ncbi:MAG: nitroreductase family deazaflavin-dependent oxidoreductase [Actinomycetota bacterium]|nr:nitroreductase family deazaflavin-dependent oxidoreductase [Actinomycetota bacterium]
MSWLAPYADEENCYLTTTGRRSGNPHEIEIWFGVAGDTLYLISGNGPTADWYRNALATPAVRVRVAASTRLGVARDVTDPQERRAVGELMGAKYPWDGDPSIGLTFEAWCFTVPALAVEHWSLP